MRSENRIDRIRYAPFVLIGSTEAGRDWSLILSEQEMRVKGPVFAEHGGRWCGNGYDWKSIAQVVIAERLPEQQEQIAFRPETELFCACGPCASLEQLGTAMRVVFQDDALLRDLLSRAEPDKSLPEIREVEADALAEITEARARGAALLHLDPETPPRDIVTAITEYMRGLQAEGAMLEQQDIIALGVLLGEQYVRAFGWHWGEVIKEGDEENGYYAVLNPDDSLAIAPLWWVSDHLKRGSTGFLLNFNLVAAGETPVFAPGTAMGLH